MNHRYEPQLSLLGILIMFSLLFMGIDCQLGCFKTIRVHMEQYFFPLHHVVHSPLQWLQTNIKDSNLYFSQQANLINQLKILQQKNLHLAGENQKKVALEYQNRKLQSLLNVSKIVQEKLLMANLVQVSSDSFSHYLMVDKGKNDGVLDNQAILDTQGVIGVVYSVNTSSSKVRLITDKSHAVPVQNMRNGLRAIVSGTGKADQLILLHAPISADYKVGDALYTSGLGGRFPKGYPVGIVDKVQHIPGQAFAQITVKPSAILNHVNEVLIVTGALVSIDDPSFKLPKTQDNVLSIFETPTPENTRGENTTAPTSISASPISNPPNTSNASSNQLDSHLSDVTVIRPSVISTHSNISSAHSSRSTSANSNATKFRVLKKTLPEVSDLEVGPRNDRDEENEYNVYDE